MVNRASLAAWQSDGANSSIRNSAVDAVITELVDSKFQVKMIDRSSFVAWQGDGANFSIRNSALGTVITELADVIAKLAAAHAAPAIMSEPVKTVVVMNARM